MDNYHNHHQYLLSQILRLDLVGALPDLTQTDGRVKAVEDGQRGGHVRDDGPGPKSIELIINTINSSVSKFNQQKINKQTNKRKKH